MYLCQVGIKNHRICFFLLFTDSILLRGEMAEISSPVNIKEKVGTSVSTAQTKMVLHTHFIPVPSRSVHMLNLKLTLCVKLSTQTGIARIRILILANEKYILLFCKETTFCQVYIFYSLVVLLHADTVESGTLCWLL